MPRGAGRPVRLSVRGPRGERASGLPPARGPRGARSSRAGESRRSLRSKRGRPSRLSSRRSSRLRGARSSRSNRGRSSRGPRSSRRSSREKRGRSSRERESRRSLCDPPRRWLPRWLPRPCGRRSSRFGISRRTRSPGAISVRRSSPRTTVFVIGSMPASRASRFTCRRMFSVTIVTTVPSAPARAVPESAASTRNRTRRSGRTSAPGSGCDR